MHEFGITQNILSIALEKANEIKSGKITKISVTLGELSGIVDEINSPSYAAAVGLILFGYQQSPQKSAGGAKLSGIFKRMPGKDIVGKSLEFIKSFLP